MMPPNFRFFLGFATRTRSFFTQRLLTTPWFKTFGLGCHASVMGQFALIQPCQSARPAPQTREKSAEFEVSNLAPWLECELPLSHCSSVRGRLRSRMRAMEVERSFVY